MLRRLPFCLRSAIRSPLCSQQDPDAHAAAEAVALAAIAAARARSNKDCMPCRVAPGLYIGGAGAARNLKALRKRGITHVVNAAPAVPCHFKDNPEGAFAYLQLPLFDDPDAGGCWSAWLRWVWALCSMGERIRCCPAPVCKQARISVGLPCHAGRRLTRLPPTLVPRPSPPPPPLCRPGSPHRRIQRLHRGRPRKRQRRAGALLRGAEPLGGAGDCPPHGLLRPQPG